MTNIYDGIYLQIKEALQQGLLPEDFTPQVEGPESPLPPAKLDVLHLYAAPKEKLGGDVPGQIGSIFRLAGNGQYEKAYEKCLRLLEKRRYASLREECENFVIKNKGGYDRNKIFFFCLEYLALNSPVPEAVKLGMSICSLPQNLSDQVKGYFDVLGLYEEFTLYAAIAYRRFEDQKKILELCQKTKGWGRLGALAFLTPHNATTQNWVFANAFKECPAPQLAAISYYKNGFYHKKIQKDNSPEALITLGEILSYLMDEDPIPYPFLSLWEGEETLVNYLALAREKAPEETREICKTLEEKHQAALLRC